MIYHYYLYTKEASRRNQKFILTSGLIINPKSCSEATKKNNLNNDLCELHRVSLSYDRVN